MDQIRIGVRVSLAAAVAAGRAEYGYGSVALSDADVAGLSPAARARLEAWATYDVTSESTSESSRRRAGLVGVIGAGNRRPDEVDVECADVPATIAAIEAVAAKAAARETAEHEANEARIAQAVAASDDAWVRSEYRQEYYVQEDGSYATTRSGRWRGGPTLRTSSGPEGIYLHDSDYRDPRIQARMAAVDLATRVEEHGRRYAEWLAGVERAEAEAKSRSAAWAAACRDYTIRWIPEYARAAREGRDVRRVARETSVASCVELLNSLDYATVKAYGEAEEHPRPHQRAYETLDRVRAEMDRARGMEIAELVDRVDVRIVRADTCSEERCSAGKRTCVEVTLRYTDSGTEAIYVYADGAPAHEHVATAEED